MNIPQYIRRKGVYYLAKTYNLSTGTLHTWANKPEGWEPPAMGRLAFKEIVRAEGEKATDEYMEMVIKATNNDNK